MNNKALGYLIVYSAKLTSILQAYVIIYLARLIYSDSLTSAIITFYSAASTLVMADGGTNLSVARFIADIHSKEKIKSSQKNLLNYYISITNLLSTFLAETRYKWLLALSLPVILISCHKIIATGMHAIDILELAIALSLFILYNVQLNINGSFQEAWWASGLFYYERIIFLAIRILSIGIIAVGASRAQHIFFVPLILFLQSYLTCLIIRRPAFFLIDCGNSNQQLLYTRSEKDNKQEDAFLQAGLKNSDILNPASSFQIWLPTLTSIVLSYAQVPVASLYLNGSELTSFYELVTATSLVGIISQAVIEKRKYSFSRSSLNVKSSKKIFTILTKSCIEIMAILATCYGLLFTLAAYSSTVSNWLCRPIQELGATVVVLLLINAVIAAMLGMVGSFLIHSGESSFSPSIVRASIVNLVLAFPLGYLLGAEGIVLATILAGLSNHYLAIPLVFYQWSSKLDGKAA